MHYKNWLPLVFGPALAMATVPRVYSPLKWFIGKGVSGPTAAVSLRISALDHKTFNYPVENCSVVEIVLGKFKKISNCIRSGSCIKFNGYIPFSGVQNCRIRLCGGGNRRSSNSVGARVISGCAPGESDWPKVEPRIFGEVSLSVGLSVIGGVFLSGFPNFINTVTNVANKIKKKISLFMAHFLLFVFEEMNNSRYYR